MKVVNFYCSGFRGSLSRELIRQGFITISNRTEQGLISFRIEDIAGNSCLVLTFSKTQRVESLQNFNDEVAWYENVLVMLKRLDKKIFLVYISSQTVYLDDSSWYAMAKLAIESLIEGSGLPFLIIRPGFICDFSNRLLMRSLRSFSLLPITIAEKGEFYSYCHVHSLVSLIKQEALLANDTYGIYCDLGKRNISFKELLNTQFKLKIRLPLPKFLFLLLSIVIPKLRKIVRPYSESKGCEVCFTSFPSPCK